VASAGADYRYGYNGMEEEDRGEAVSSEIASTGEKAKPGEANLLNTEFRLYDPRLGQWLTPDPVFQPWESPYSAMAGNPILFGDPQGLDATVSECSDADNNIFLRIEYEPKSGKNWTESVFLGVRPSEAQVIYVPGTDQFKELSTGSAEADGYINKFALFEAVVLFSNAFGGTGSIDFSFTWHEKESNHDNGMLNTERDRREASISLAISIANQHIKGDDIIMIGFSHGSNVALQALPTLDHLLKEKYGNDYSPKYKLISLNAPAYSGTMESEEPFYDDIEDPCKLLMCNNVNFNMTHFFDAGRTFGIPSNPNDETVTISRLYSGASYSYKGDVKNDSNFDQFQIHYLPKDHQYYREDAKGHAWFYFEGIVKYNLGIYSKQRLKK
jgi:RHS repeat-associated protein